VHLAAFEADAKDMVPPRGPAIRLYALPDAPQGIGGGPRGKELPSWLDQKGHNNSPDVLEHLRKQLNVLAKVKKCLPYQWRPRHSVIVVKFDAPAGKTNSGRCTRGLLEPRSVASSVGQQYGG
jgi:hypothetical protein